ncbi:MAG: Asp-tRNA(Asn)/Glu-tRNA(Gln) amidotransferase GatCAB subunit C [Piscirickettsiaceae bacterium CG_4_9_14_3_um_filter_43_564]|nr:Asp-tRNA(Asn)/Glu-tRNA(Gln) amidotransferase subunit GatC [Thiomicrospira sp.]OIP93811.1 MAG: asparaginyl/glutamyl-tRNA amidotransferase subunit C [Thiomicrospira sp. CG2_30_44_34]PIQ06423.1 MAG: Asp-tRNA(Asn)/Glu-tRNA(Gln) amidotransferase GatCAB subunit C [Piscirickettsiaceae bacterium CG18_big_fil_WC_8_21_14_2_50_44_103]PIU37834.1 MAG: Asp-tRNA(Asn)/Glu-tRNA(Gln) amidotransferase GatCAB subunit C [Piscirickettsiaceae bacterium CG07_land_8_20_14_0_80_44_28]PIW57206.1 MAG: Asp-tRNA(Asn)/Glu
MSLQKTEVDAIARLAGISVDPAEGEQLTAKLSNVLAIFQQMQAIDTNGIEPMAHPLDQVQRLREDCITETNHREAYQSLAPKAENGLYLVPQVID